MAHNMTSNIDAKCQTTVEVSYPLFVIHTNHVTTIPDKPIYTLCQQIHTAGLQNFSIADELVSLQDILTAIFDSAHRAFVLPDTPAALLATLSADARACIFAQAIAGIVYFLRNIASSPLPLMAEHVEAKLRKFASSEERTKMLATVEAWPGWGDCFEKAQIGGIIMQAVGVDLADEVDKTGAGAVSVIELDDLVEAPALWNDGPHLTREFGVPDRFTIMALN